MLLWNSLNAFALVVALQCVVGRRHVALALLLVLPELYNATQASQSNALVAALIVLAFVALEGSRQTVGYGAIALGVAIKIFPVAALSFAIFHRRRLRAALTFTICAVILAALPLVVTSPAMLVSQYRWWDGIESTDTRALGDSVMLVLHDIFRISWPNWPVQLVGVVVLLTPLLHRNRWNDAIFRRTFLASLLIFVVIFNHQAERQSFVIAAVGVAVWFVDSPRDHFRLAIKEIKLRISLADALIIGVKFFRAKLPMIRLAHRQHRVTIFGIAGNTRQRHEARVAGTMRPIRWLMRGWVRQLPVGHAFHDGEDGFR